MQKCSPSISAFTPRVRCLTFRRLPPAHVKVSGTSSSSFCQRRLSTDSLLPRKAFFCLCIEECHDCSLLDPRVDERHLGRVRLPIFSVPLGVPPFYSLGISVSCSSVVTLTFLLIGSLPVPRFEVPWRPLSLPLLLSEVRLICSPVSPSLCRKVAC